jgi:hypothetical protein
MHQRDHARMAMSKVSLEKGMLLALAFAKPARITAAKHCLSSFLVILGILNRGKS